MSRASVALAVLLSGALVLVGCGRDSEAPASKKKGPEAKSKAEPWQPASPEIARAVREAVREFYLAIDEGRPEALNALVTGYPEQVNALTGWASGRSDVIKLKAAIVAKFGDEYWSEVSDQIDLVRPIDSAEDLAAWLENAPVETRRDQARITLAGREEPLALKQTNDSWQVVSSSFFTGDMKSSAATVWGWALEAIAKKGMDALKDPAVTKDELKKSLGSPDDLANFKERLEGN